MMASIVVAHIQVSALSVMLARHAGGGSAHASDLYLGAHSYAHIFIYIYMYIYIHTYV